MSGCCFVLCLSLFPASASAAAPPSRRRPSIGYAGGPQRPRPPSPAAPIPAPSLPRAALPTAAVQVSGLSETGFRAYLPRLRQAALRQGVSRATIDRVFPSLAFSRPHRRARPAQPGGAAGQQREPAVRALSRPPRHAGPGRPRPRPLRRTISARLNDDRPALRRRRRRCWSRSGARRPATAPITGDFDLLNSLASLAYEGRRRELFADEFVATLKMIDRGFPRCQLKGSWAGATGQSAIPAARLHPPRRRRRRRRPRGHLAQPARRARLDRQLSQQCRLEGRTCPGASRCAVPAGFDRAAIANTAARAALPARPRAPQPLADRRPNGAGCGIVAERQPGPRQRAGLACSSRTARAGTAYLLTTNYRTILDYNCSNFYALSVGLLADPDFRAEAGWRGMPLSVRDERRAAAGAGLQLAFMNGC